MRTLCVRGQAVRWRAGLARGSRKGVLLVRTPSPHAATTPGEWRSVSQQGLGGIALAD